MWMQLITLKLSDFKLVSLITLHASCAEYELQVDHYTKAFTEAELLEKLPNYHAIGIRSKTKMTAKVIDACPQVGQITRGVSELTTTPIISITDSPISSCLSVAFVLAPIKSTFFMQRSMVLQSSTLLSQTPVPSLSWSLRKSFLYPDNWSIEPERCGRESGTSYQKVAGRYGERL